MTLEVTDAVMLRMATLAVNASHPVGMGFIHYKPKDYTQAEVEAYFPNGAKHITIDYFEGRMVKFYASRVETGWDVREDLDIEYQSWKYKYPDWQALQNEALNNDGDN